MVVTPEEEVNKTSVKMLKCKMKKNLPRESLRVVLAGSLADNETLYGLTRY